MDVPEAIKIISSIADNKDPFTDGGFSSKNTPENNPETVKALCVALSVFLKQIGYELKGSASHCDTPLNDSTSEITLKVLSGVLPLEKAMEMCEREILLRAMKMMDNNITKAAELVGLSFRQLRYKLQKYGIT